MSIEELASKYFDDHSKPIKKLEHFGSKLFLTKLEANQAECQAQILDGMERKLKQSYVDRRCARSVAEWIPLEKHAKATKITGAIKDFGFQNKNGKFLKVEECLVLMEMNKLELIHKNGVPMSIEDIFKQIDNLKSYFIYRDLVLKGLKLRVCDDDDEHDEGPPTKVQKLDDDNSIFSTLRLSGPQNKNNQFLKSSGDYLLKKQGKTMKTKIWEGEWFDSSQFSDKCTLLGLTDGDNISFFKFNNTQIPKL